MSIHIRDISRCKEGSCVRPHQGHFSVLFPVISFCGSGVGFWSPDFLQFRLALEWACVLLSAAPPWWWRGKGVSYLLLLHRRRGHKVCAVSCTSMVEGQGVSCLLCLHGGGGGGGHDTTVGTQGVSCLLHLHGVWGARCVLVLLY